MTQNKIVETLNVNKELQKNLKKLSHYSVEQFVSDANRYIQASKENRLICSIDKVSASGMSRTMKFVEMHKERDGQHRIYNFFAFFTALGHTRTGDYFRINGCGMDMVFATHYNNIFNLKSMGLINDATCKILSQKTPSVI